MKKLKYFIYIAQIISVILLLLALRNNPYDFYIGSKWIISVITGFLAYIFYKNDKKVYIWLFIGMAIIFNQIIPIYLYQKGLWNIIDIISIVIVISSIVEVSKIKKLKY